MDRKSSAAAIARLQEEKRALETSSDLLQTLAGHRRDLEGRLEQTEKEKAHADKQLGEIAANRAL